MSLASRHPIFQIRACTVRVPILQMTVHNLNKGLVLLVVILTTVARAVISLNLSIVVKRQLGFILAVAVP